MYLTLQTPESSGALAGDLAFECIVKKQFLI